MNSKELLESLDSGSNYSFGDKMDLPNNPKSVFDLSHLNSLTIPNAGMVIPVGLLEALPGDDFTISVDVILRVLPQVVPMYSRQRLYIYAFGCNLSDIWQNFDVFIRKGYSGNVIKSIPQLNKSNCIVPQDDLVHAESFADYLGLPIGAKLSETTLNDGKGLLNAGLSACIPFMGLKIWRDYFMNKNYFINDRIVLPDDDSRFRLNDDGELLSAKDVGKKLYFDIFGSWNDVRYDDNGNLIFSGFYHDYPDDYFVSALPFTQRGDEPFLDYTVDLSQLGLDFTSSFTRPTGFSDVENTTQLLASRYSQNADDTEHLHYLGALVNNYNNTSDMAMRADSTLFTMRDGTSRDTSVHNSSSSAFAEALNRGKVTGSNIGLKIGLNAIRKLCVEQTELEKMAKTDGSFRQFGITFFGEADKNAQDFRPVYIGGTYKNIVFTEVLQTSGSNVGTTDPDSKSPLGAYAGHGITGISDGYIGKYHSTGYGYIMFFACIMPDIYYSQGIDKLWTRSLQSEFYLPERAKLGLQPILNKELFYSGNNGNETEQDDYLWAYQNPFDEYRYSKSTIHGKIADPNNLSFFPYTQSRKFTSLPNWGREFAEANNVRKDSFFAPIESGYTAQFGFNIRAVRELSYKSIPAKII